MAKHERFHYHSLEEILADVKRLGLPLKATRDISVLLKPVKVGNLTAPNALAVHPMEGCDGTREGRPDELTYRRYQAFRRRRRGPPLVRGDGCRARGARQSAADIPQRKHLRRLRAPGRGVALAAARESMGPAHRPLMILQLTHSGRYSKPDGKAAPIIAHHSAVLDKQHKLPADYPLVTDDELERLIDRFVDAAKLAKRAGFDGIDIKSCHRYLVAELHASFTRENSRSAAVSRTARASSAPSPSASSREVPGLLVGLRMNAYDAHPVPVRLGRRQGRLHEARPHRAQGAHQGAPPHRRQRRECHYRQPLLQSPLRPPVRLPHRQRLRPRGASARRRGAHGGHRRPTYSAPIPGFPIVGHRLLVASPVRPQLRRRVVEDGGGTFVGFGRHVLRDAAFPEVAHREGRLDPLEVCVACSSCTQIMRDGGKTGCVVRDGEVYGPIYLEGRMKDMAEARTARARHAAPASSRPALQAAPRAWTCPGSSRPSPTATSARRTASCARPTRFPRYAPMYAPPRSSAKAAASSSFLARHPVPIRALQRYVSERARAEGWAQCRRARQAVRQARRRRRRRPRRPGRGDRAA